MALATYTDLVAQVAAYLGRADLTTQIPVFVTLAQNKINRRVKALAMETKNAAFSITGEYVTVPADFIEVRNFYIPGRLPLEYMAPDEMTSQYQSTAGTPLFYCIVGTQFRFAPVPGSSATATLVYSAKPAVLVTTSQETNSLFPTHADLYLYGALLEAEAYCSNDARLSVWKQGYQEALEDVNGSSTRGRYGTPLATRPG